MSSPQPTPASTATSALVTEAHQALERAVQVAGGEFPPEQGAGPEATAEVLDALARVSGLVPRTMTRVTGAGDATVERLAEQLSTALVPHRNLTLTTRGSSGPS